MSAVPSNALDAIALQLVTALEQYDRDAAAMVAAWPDMERYQSVSEQVERIRMFSSALPDLRVAWVELLIAHAELVHVLWRAQYGEAGGDGADLTRAREAHGEAVAALQSRCLRAVARPRPSHPEAQG